MKFGKVAVFIYFCRQENWNMADKEIKAVASKVQRIFAGQPVSKAWLFGSFARGEETQDSDIDILVRYDNGAHITLFTISRLSLALEEVFNREVDLIEEDCLLPFASEGAKKDQILIYERTN